MNRSIQARGLRLAPTLGLFAALGGQALGQALEQEYVTPTLGTTTQKFGAGVATQADLLVVGASHDDTNGADAGAAYVYRWNAATQSWGYEAQLFPSDPEVGANFGCATAVYGDIAVVGAYLEDNTKGVDAGAVYIFRRNTTTGVWAQEQKLIASVGAANDQFGLHLVLVDKALMVGSHLSDTTAGVDSGSAFIYRWKNSIVKWVEETQFVDPNGGASDQAGTGIGFDGITAVMGAPLYENPGEGDSGSVSIWTVSGTTWSYSAQIRPTVIQNWTSFGYSVGVSGNEIVVGSPYYDAAGFTDEGAGYFFSKASGTWTQTALFDNPDAAHYDYFGLRATMAGKLAIVGSHADNAFGRSDSGALFTFRKGNGANGWFIDQELAASDGAVSDFFGNGLAASDEHIVVGASHNDTASGTDWGVVYGFDADEINVKLNPTNPLPGGTMNISIYDGAENDPVLLVIDEVDGIPTWIEVVLYVFGADHRLTFDADMENPLLGFNIGVKAWKVSPTGALVSSDRVFADV